MALDSNDMNSPEHESATNTSGTGPQQGTGNTHQNGVSPTMEALAQRTMHDDDEPPESYGRYPCITFLLSLFCPGLGHMYIGLLRKGIILATIGALYIHLLSLGLMGMTFESLAMYVIIAIAYFIYIIVDSVITAFRKQDYQLKQYNNWRFYVSFAILTLCLNVGSSAVSKRYGALEAFKTPSGSMMGTLLVGDHLIADRTYPGAAAPTRGDIIIFRYPMDPRKNFIKRVIATGGDTVEIVDKRVRLNGLFIPEPYALHTDSAVLDAAEGRRDNIPPATVPEGSVFVLGDNRDDSHDSRYWGFVEDKDIKAKALYIYWSWNTVTSTPRFKRIGALIR